MKTIRFTAYPDGYKCSEPGEQSGDYVKLSDVQSGIDEALRLEREKTTPIILAREARIAELEKALADSMEALTNVQRHCGLLAGERARMERAAEVLKKGKHEPSTE